MDRPASPTVSVVMPTYNRAKLLPDVIASILNQDYRDLELLIVDDCSTDCTKHVIHTIRQQDERLRYRPLPENQGIGFARQVGLENAFGKYIALADSDDLWMPGKLKAQVEVMEAHPEIDILFGDYININHITNQEGVSGFKHTASGMSRLKTKSVQGHLFIVEDGVAAGMLVANFLAVPTMVIRTSGLEKTGGFNANLLSAADLEFGFRAAARGAKFAFLDYPLIYRHIYSDSDTANAIRANIMVVKALIFCRQLCVSIDRNDLAEHVDRALQRTYLSLMYGFGKDGKRNQVWTSYRNAVSHGFSLHDFALFCISIGGSQTIGLFERVRRVKQTRLTRK